MTEAKKEQTLEDRLIEAMSDMVNPTKSKTANVGKYSYQYESLDDVLGIVRPALIAHGLGLTQMQSWSDHTNSYALRTIVFDGTTERVMDERPLRDCPDAQQAGSWETYMRRYALRSAFGLAGEDDDGAATLNKQQPKQTKQQQGKAKSEPKPISQPEAPQDEMTPIQAAKARLWDACKAYADKFKADEKRIGNGVKQRPDYEETVEFFTSVAEEFEAEL